MEPERLDVRHTLVMLTWSALPAALWRVPLFVALALVSGCASFPSHIEPGMARADVVARFGQPSVEVTEPDHAVLIYSTAPYGELAYAAVFDQHEVVTKVFQVLTIENFARAERGVWNKQIVLNNYGLPAEKRNIRGNETWDYRYRENDVYYSLYTFTFDSDGTLIKGENGPDPLRDGGRGGNHK